jgi:hypothetical protein
MADKKVTQLDALTTLSADDLFMVVDDPAGTPTNKKVTAGNVLGNINIPAAVGPSGSFSLRTLTPTSDNSTTQYPTGSIWFDEFYMYVVVNQTSNGIKRIALSEF